MTSEGAHSIESKTGLMLTDARVGKAAWHYRIGRLKVGAGACRRVQAGGATGGGRRAA